MRARSVAGRLALGLVAAVLTLGLMELGVRLLLPQDLDYFNSAKIRRPSARPGITWELIPGARSASYIGVPVAINSLGLRDRELTVPKPPGTVRILAVGDSVTFGYGVALEDTFPKLLEARLNAGASGPTRYEVVNAGVEATGLDQYYHFVESSAAALEPDALLVNLALNDIAPYRDPSAPPPPRVDGGRTLLRRVNGALLLNSHLYLLSYMSLKSFLYRTGVLDINRVHDYDFLALERPSERQARAWRATLGWLDRLVGLARQRGWPAAVVVFPMEVQLTPGSLALYRREFGTELGPAVLAGEPQRRLADWGAARDVPVIDLLPAFRAAADRPLYLRNRAITFDPVHPSPLGHAVAAAALHEALGTTLPLDGRRAARPAPVAPGPRG